MKKKILSILFIFALGFSLVACGGNKTTKANKSNESQTQKNTNNTTVKENKTTEATSVIELAKTEFTDLYNQVKTLLDDEKIEVLDVVYESIIAELDNVDGTIDQVKATINAYKTELTNVINLVKETYTELTKIKEQAIRELEALYNRANKVANDVNKPYITNIFNKAKAQIESLTDSSNVKATITDIINEYKDDIEKYIKTKIDEELQQLIQKSLDDLDSLYNKINEKSLDSHIQAIVDEAYNDAQASLSSLLNKSLFDQNLENTMNSFKSKVFEYASDLFELTVTELKALAKEKLDELVDNALSKLEDEQLKSDLNSFYTTEIQKIETIVDKDTAKSVVSEIETDTVEFIEEQLLKQLNILKKKAKDELDSLVNGALNKINDTELKSDLSSFYTTEINKIDSINSLDNIKTTLEEIVSDTEKFVQEELKKELLRLKNLAISELDSLVDNALSKLEDEKLKSDLDSFYKTEIAKVNAIDSLENINETISEIKEDTIKFIEDELKNQLSKYKTLAKEELDKAVNEALSKLEDNTLKTNLSNYYTSKMNEIDNINSIDSAKETINGIKEDVVNYAKEVVASVIAGAKALVKEYLNELTQAMNFSPYSYIPEAMRPNYSANLVKASDLEYDFTKFTNVNDIKYGGFGEQWNMVIKNITESERFYKFLSYSDSAMALAINAINEYLGSKYTDSINTTIENDKFKLSLKYDDENADFKVLTFIVEYNVGISIPLFGEINPKITLVNYIDGGFIVGSVELSSTNTFEFSVKENEIGFGYEYGIEAGSRTSTLNIMRDGDIVTGEITEYITLKGKDLVKSSADFYIKDNYVSVVGNKASGMIGFSGYINELYKADEGKLLGYEIRETLTVLGVSGQYNTLWFNLSDISGITSVKVLDHENGDEKNPNDIYVNGNDSKIFTPTYNKKLTVKTSRMYDIELRKQYFYAYDETTQSYVEIETEVPMMFIQADNDKDTNFTDYPTNVSLENSITSNVTLNSTYLNKIESDYSTLIDKFIEKYSE